MATPTRALAFALAISLALHGCAGAPRADSAADAGAAARLRADVAALTSAAMQGRRTGSEGERLATEFVAREFARIGLAPAGPDASWFQPFEFTAGVSIGPGNELRSEGPAPGSARAYALDTDWRPLAFSRTGEAPAAPVVFAGYGIVAPANGKAPAYDSYSGLDVRGRFALVLRYAPQDVEPELRQHWSHYTSLRHKVMLARDRGALGVLIASGPRSGVRGELVPLRNDVAAGGTTSVFALSLADAPAASWLAGAGRSLDALQAALDAGETRVGFEIPGLRIAARVDLVQERRSGRNVLARLRGHESAAPVLVGAHVDHLGAGIDGSSLASESERGQVHPGADDNASGVAAVLEIARRLAALQRLRPDAFARDVLFAAWSGEEIGLIGSSAFASAMQDPVAQAHGAPRPLAAVLNLDMVGRLRDHLILQGVGSSSVWPSLIEAANASRALPLSLQEDSYLPTDATSFYLKGIPVLSAFTGVHPEYHTPRDTPDLLNYEGLAAIADLFAAIAESLASRRELPDFTAPTHAAPLPPRAGLRVYLGTIPSYGEAQGEGLLLAGVAPGGPAERAGLRAGDRIVELAGHAIENIYDYTYALETLEIGRPVPIAVEREGARVRLEVTPASRD